MKKITTILKSQSVVLMCLLAVSVVFMSACKDDDEMGPKAGEGTVIFQISKKNLYALSSLSEMVAVKPILEFGDQTIVLPSLDLTGGGEDVIQSEAFTLKAGVYKVKSYRAADKDGNWIADLVLEDNNTFEVKEGREPVFFNVSAGIRVNLSKDYFKNILLGICNEIWPNDKSKWAWKEEDKWEDWKHLEWEVEEGTGALLALTGIIFNHAFYDMETLPEPACNISTLENFTIIGDSVKDGVTLKNKFKYLPKKIVHTDVKVLTIINCEFDEIPEFLMDCDLHSLTIVDCNLKTIPESISKLKNLKLLCLKGNQLTTIPSSITELKKLQSLDLSGNPIQSIPADAFKGCTALQEIILSNTNVSTLPDMPLISEPEFELGDIIGRGLYLDGCKFTSIPNTALTCPAICLISLKNNQITSVDLNEDQAKNLNSLFLDGNKITGLKVASSKLVSLTLSNSGLQSMPSDIKAENLKVLNLKGNSITSVPEGYFLKYPQISQADLSGNQLAQLPSELGFTMDDKGPKELNLFGLNNMPQLVWRIPATWTNALLHKEGGVEGTLYDYPVHYVNVKAFGSGGVTR